jgi:hypothetical protein
MMNGRFLAFGVALIASGAFILGILSGVNCEFADLIAKPGITLLNIDGAELSQETAPLGVYCTADDVLFDVGSDNMWGISRIFFIVSVVVGSITAALAWLVTFFLPPTPKVWRGISVMSAFTAVSGVPVFLLFESEPCTQFTFQQECTFSTGSYIQIASVIAWIVGVIVTQYVEPPEWGNEKACWRIDDGDREQQGYEDPDPEYGANFRITGYTPTESTKQSKASGWAAFVSRFSKFNNLDLEHVETDSIREGDEQDHPLDTSLDQRLNLRVLPNGKLPGDEGPSFASFDDLDTLVRLADEGKLRDSPMIMPQPTSPTSRDIIKVISNAEDENEMVATSFPSYPAYQEEPLKPRYPYKPKNVSQSPEPVAKALSPAKHANADRVPAEKSLEPSPQKVSGISKGYNITRLEQSVLPVTTNKEKSNRLVESDDKKKKSIRNLTKRFKQDVRRRTSRRSRMQRIGYSQMLDEEMSGGSSFSFQSPPIQIKIDLSENKNDDLFLKDEEIRLDSKDDEQLLDDWNALHAATSAGFQMGFQEGTGVFESFQDEPNKKFDIDVQSYHSDPEPVLYSSDEEDDINIAARSIPRNIGHGDNSTLSSHSSASARLRESTKRGRSLIKKTISRRRRARSPLGSLASGSLMGTTIDEETVQDILEESSVENGADTSLENVYSLERTMSAPQPNTSGLGKLLARRGRRSSSKRTASVRRKRPTDMTSPSWQQASLLNTGTAVSSENKSLNSATPLSPSDGIMIERIDNLINQMDEGMLNKPTSPPPRKLTVRRNHSMDNVRNQRKRIVQSSSQSVSAIQSRQTRLRSRLVYDDDNSSNSSNSSRSRVKKARELRRQRLQNQSMSMDTYTGRSGVNTSYLSKSTNSSVNQGRDYSFNIEDDEKTQVVTHNDSTLKKEIMDDEVPFDQVKPPQIITPDSVIGAPFFKEEKKEDDLLVNEVDPAPKYANTYSAFSEDHLNVDQQKKNVTDTTFDSDRLNVDTIIQTSSIYKDDNISVVTPHLDMKDSMDEDDDQGTSSVREKIMAGFSFTEDKASVSMASTDNSEKYGSSVMDELDLQLIEVRRPIDREYGDEEASL